MIGGIPTYAGMFQVAYVVRNMDEAVATFARDHGVEGFRVMEFELNLNPPGKTVLKVALGWVDDHEFELIEPIRDETGVFEPKLPVAPANMVLHHVAARIPGELEDWERFRSAVPDNRVVIEGGRDGMRFIYVDALDTLGHHLEYIWMNDDFLAANPYRIPPSQRKAS